MVKRPPLLIFDVESVGLHGEGFAWGLVLIENGEVTNEALAWCTPNEARTESWGPFAARSWIEEHVVPKLVRATTTPTHSNPHQLRDEFWTLWRGAKDKFGALLMADCAWPVEANFLSACIADHGDERAWSGPYPLLDAATLRFGDMASATEDIHDPLEDARRTWLSIRGWWLP